MQSLSKCSSQYVLRITPDKLIFVLSEKDIRANGATAWCEIPKDAYFSDYKMEGVTTEDNEIFMEINTGRSLREFETNFSHGLSAEETN